MAKGDKIVVEIGEMLQVGTKRANILASICTKWRISDRTFDRYWKKANDKAKDAQQAIDDALTNALTEEAVTALRAGLKSDLELEVILCQIATNNLKVEEFIEGNVVLRGISPTEITGAIRELWKKRGSYAPTKVAKTNKDGEDVESYEITLKL